MQRDLTQGELAIERMCALAGVSRAGYYRAWQASAPREEETGLRDGIQRIALASRGYGYRRVQERAFVDNQRWLRFDDSL